MSKPQILIISPALAKANNGNWQTAARWSAFLRHRFQVTCTEWTAGLSGHLAPALIIALHARRSAAALVEFDRAQPAVPLLLVLTGTDLYRDIHDDPVAQKSLQIADRLILLQKDGMRELDLASRSKACVIYQSAPTLHPARKASRPRRFKVIMIGHLRAEKDPLTFLRAIALVHNPRVYFTHIGAALDPVLEYQARATNATHRYRWLGNQAHALTRQRLKHSDVMVLSSIMEGGANVIIEAITSDVAVLASDISGNRGLLGDDYAGYFPVGDAAALAQLIERVATDAVLLARLRAQCRARAQLFVPERERAAVCALVDNCLQISAHGTPGRPHTFRKDVL